MQETYGGHLHKQAKAKDNHKQCYQWSLSYQPAFELVRELLPYLRIKGEEAEILLELEHLKGTRKRVVSIEMAKEREHLFQLLKEIKHV